MAGSPSLHPSPPSPISLSLSFLFSCTGRKHLAAASFVGILLNFRLLLLVDPLWSHGELINYNDNAMTRPLACLLSYYRLLLLINIRLDWSNLKKKKKIQSTTLLSFSKWLTCQIWIFQLKYVLADKRYLIKIGISNWLLAIVLFTTALGPGRAMTFRRSFRAAIRPSPPFTHTHIQTHTHTHTQYYWSRTKYIGLFPTYVIRTLESSR